MKTEEIKSYLTGSDRGLLVPTEQDFFTLTGLRSAQFVIYDEIYKDAAGNSHRFWPENKALITGGGPGYTVGGVRIAEMLNGLVPVSTRSTERVSFMVGPQVERYVDIESNTEMMRVASARMLHINAPEAIVVATLWT